MFSKDEDEVADLFQEILINLWKGFSKFRGECGPRTWIWKASLNTCISADRKKKRMGKSVPLEMNINLFDDVNPDTEQIRMLHDRIGRLGYFDRAIIAAIIAAVLGALIGFTIRSRTIRAANDLLDQINELKQKKI